MHTTTPEQIAADTAHLVRYGFLIGCETLIPDWPRPIMVVPCTNRDDMNYGGFDLLGRMPDDSWACFGEIATLDRVAAILRGKDGVTSTLQARLRVMADTSRQPSIKAIVDDLQAILDDTRPNRTRGTA